MEGEKFQIPEEETLLTPNQEVESGEDETIEEIEKLSLTMEDLASMDENLRAHASSIIDLQEDFGVLENEIEGTETPPEEKQWLTRFHQKVSKLQEIASHFASIPLKPLAVAGISLMGAAAMPEVAEARDQRVSVQAQGVSRGYQQFEQRSLQIENIKAKLEQLKEKKESAQAELNILYGEQPSGAQAPSAENVDRTIDAEYKSQHTTLLAKKAELNEKFAKISNPTESQRLYHQADLERIDLQILNLDKRFNKKAQQVQSRGQATEMRQNSRDIQRAKTLERQINQFEQQERTLKVQLRQAESNRAITIIRSVESILRK